MIALCEQIATSFPVHIFGVSLTWSIGPIERSYGMVDLTAFAFSNGSVSVSSFTWMLFCPAMRA